MPRIAFKPDSRCYGKVPYMTMSGARAAARGLRSRKGGNLVSYPCCYCRRFHIGNRRTRSEL